MIEPLTILAYAIGGLAAFLLGWWGVGILQCYHNRFDISLTEALFEFGMEIKRRNEANELSLPAKIIGYLYVFLVFLPVDFYLQFKVASQQFQVKPKFELTTTLVNRWLHADAATDAELREKEFVVAMRSLLDNYDKNPVDGVRACSALGYFDIIDTKRGHTEHFRNANDFRSRFDPNLE